MVRTGKSRAHCTNLIWHYQKKRREAKIKYPRGTKEREPALEKIRRKLMTYRRAVARIDQQTKELEIINNKIKSFFGYTMYKSSTNWIIMKNKTKEQYTVKRMFCKVAMERGVPSYLIGIFIGHPASLIPNYRRVVTKQIAQKDTDTLRTWERFKKVINRPDEQSKAE